jgi:prepilin-type N-terminal cleavage/methylation domain-containing protein
VWVGFKEPDKGFTLVEIMMSMLVFAISMIALAGFYISTARLNESSRNLTQAINDARVVSEAIRDTSTAGLAAVTATNWTNWATANSLTSLSNEAIAVTYGALNADPLQVQIRVNWLERGRAKTTAIDTLVTQR